MGSGKSNRLASGPEYDPYYHTYSAPGMLVGWVLEREFRTGSDAYPYLSYGQQADVGKQRPGEEAS